MTSQDWQPTPLIQDPSASNNIMDYGTPQWTSSDENNLGIYPNNAQLSDQNTNDSLGIFKQAANNPFNNIVNNADQVDKAIQDLQNIPAQKAIDANYQSQQANTALQNSNIDVAQKSDDAAKAIINTAGNPVPQATQDYNTAMALYNQGNGQPSFAVNHPIIAGGIGALLGGGIGAGIGLLAGGKSGYGGQDAMLLGGLGAMAGFSDASKAKNAYLAQQNAMREELVKKFVDEISNKTAAETIKNTAQTAASGSQVVSNGGKLTEANSIASKNDLEQQQQLGSQELNMIQAQAHGEGGVYVDPNTGQPILATPAAQKQVAEAIASQGVTDAAQNALSTNYLHPGIGASLIPATSGSNPNVLTGGVSTNAAPQTQSNYLSHFGWTPEDNKTVASNQGKGLQENIQNKNVQSEIGHRKVQEQQGQEKVNQGWKKTELYAQNIGNLIKNRDIGTGIKQQAERERKTS